MEADIHVDSPLQYASIQILSTQNRLVLLLYIVLNREGLDEIFSCYCDSFLRPCAQAFCVIKEVNGPSGGQLKGRVKQRDFESHFEANVTAIEPTLIPLCTQIWRLSLFSFFSHLFLFLVCLVLVCPL